MNSKGNHVKYIFSSTKVNILYLFVKYSNLDNKSEINQIKSNQISPKFLMLCYLDLERHNPHGYTIKLILS
jgi:hypothetical protein